MKSVSPSTLTALKTSHHVNAGLKVVAEFRHNSLSNPVAVNSGSATEYNADLFPIDSIIESIRPSKSGIVKSLVGLSKTVGERTADPDAVRYYLAGKNDKYKYWMGPTFSTSLGAVTGFSPEVSYRDTLDAPKTVVANRIDIAVENNLSNPTQYSVQIKTSTSASWSTIATQSNFSFPTGGRAALYFDGVGSPTSSSSWSTTPNLNSSTNIHAVRFVVTAATANRPVALIELGAVLERDISSDVVSYSHETSLADRDFITPLGTVSSDTASISLFNEDMRWNKRNASSPYYGLLDRNVKITAWYLVDGEEIQDCVMYTDMWESDESDCSVSCFDVMKRMQDIKPNPKLLRNTSAPEAMWRLLDSIGFTDYVVDVNTLDAPGVINNYWTDTEKTIFEHIAELSVATQTAVYIDSYGKLMIKSRNQTFDATKTSSYVLTRDGVSGYIPNIITAKDSTAYEPNSVKITYKPTDYGFRNGYRVEREQVWTPDADTVLLRADGLLKSLSETDTTYITLSSRSNTWPYSGFMNIDGEIIEYKGVGYQYFDSTLPVPSLQYAIVYSKEEQDELDKKTDYSQRWRNGRTGVYKIEKRGALGSIPAPHTVGLQTNWFYRQRKNYGSATNLPLPTVIADTSKIMISSNGVRDNYTYLFRGSNTFPANHYIGAALAIPDTTDAEKSMGIYFQGADSTLAGYYLEITHLTSARFKAGKKNDAKNNIVFYSMKSDGSKKAFGQASRAFAKLGKGAQLGVSDDILFLKVDIQFNPNTHEVRVYIDGTLHIKATVPSGEWRMGNKNSGGKYGIFTRGDTVAFADYVYAAQSSAFDNSDDPADFPGGVLGFYDFIKKSYTSKFIDLLRFRYSRNGKAISTLFFDDFGPVVHEVREYTVEFTPDEPVLLPRFYLANTRQATLIDFQWSPSSAYFIVANTSRNDAVLQGDDNFSLGEVDEINYPMFIYGQVIKFGEESEILRENKASIRKRGLIETTFESTWIQNKSEAEAIAEWVVDRWANSDTIIEAEVFGNPLFELTDVVRVKHNSIDADFYIVGISTSFDQGISTTLTLKQV